MRPIEEFPYDILNNIPVIGKNKQKYLNCIMAFDIETTTVNDTNFMYIWQFSIKLIGEKAQAFYGRTWSKFIDFITALDGLITANAVIFVHNLSYEFQYLRSFEKLLNMNNYLFTDRRKIIKFDALSNIEFRCSYRQTNMSLAVFTAKYKAIHKKLPDYEYNAILYPDSVLSKEQMAYCENDVLGLCEAMENRMIGNNDNIETLPLTSTGYVRRMVKNNLSDNAINIINNAWPDKETYIMLLEAVRGGNTHANRIYSGEILTNVYSYDRRSSYPGVQCANMYPITQFREVDNSVENFNYCFSKGKPILARIALRYIEVNDTNGCPYIPLAKCRNIKNYVLDNGRILKCDYLEITITDIDFEIIRKTYKIKEYGIIKLKISTYGKLPACYIDNILTLFKNKTLLKNVKGEELFYMLSKEMLNSIFGMSATKPVREDIEYSNYDYHIQPPENYTEKLAKARYNAFFLYQWGVWCLAWARWELQELINLAGIDFVYTDTDSVKSLRDLTPEIAVLNNRITRNCISSRAYITTEKEKYYCLGVWEEDEHYKKFLTWGAKKYAYETDDLHITIAGVNKTKGAAELKKRGGIEALKPGFIFYESAGLEAKFNDDCRYYSTILNGHRIEMTSSIILSDSTYTLDLTKDYYKLLDERSLRKILYEINLRNKK